MRQDFMDDTYTVCALLSRGWCRYEGQVLHCFPWKEMDCYEQPGQFDTHDTGARKAF
jgi:hypothetical protein